MTKSTQPRFILALDQGTTSSRAIIFDENARVVSMAQQAFKQHFPKPGWVEHDATEIWQTQLSVAQKAIKMCKMDPKDIAAIGITNQRETSVVWDRKTGKPIAPAIVWQDKRTAEICEGLKSAGHEKLIRKKTGLVVDAYFSGTKVAWLLDQDPSLRERAENSKLCFGTIDSWLIWNLTGGRSHVTDYSNASRTMLFNIEAGEWDPELCAILRVPMAMLPTVQDSASLFGQANLDLIKDHRIPICGVAGDQQAALFGQRCISAGMAKNTYGTGCFMLLNTGEKLIHSENGLLTTIAWSMNGKMTYALEGSVFIAGAAIQWLRDGLKMMSDSAESEKMANDIEDTDGVYVVPAFAGLGAPYWDMYARGAIFGLTRGSNQEHIVRATLDSLAYQTRDVLDAMERDGNLDLTALRVDGGASANNYLMQFQADILGVNVERPANLETTAFGAACFAGLHAGVWTEDDLSSLKNKITTFVPEMDASIKKQKYHGWKEAVKRTRNWLKDSTV